MQDQLPGLTGAASQFNAGPGRKGFRIEAQVKRQNLVVADQAGAGEQLLRAVLIVDHQQCQFDFSASWNALQGAAQFTLMGGQRAECGGLPGFLLRLLRHRARRWRLGLGCIAAAGHQQAENTEQNERT
ncbi:hypothetical protein D3C78_844530 [compost metagenome]